MENAGSYMYQLRFCWKIRISRNSDSTIERGNSWLGSAFRRAALSSSPWPQRPSVIYSAGSLDFTSCLALGWVIPTQDKELKVSKSLWVPGLCWGHHPNAYQLGDQGDTGGCIFACMSWQELGHFCCQELKNIALSKTINSCILLSTFQFCVYFLSSNPLRSSYKITTGPISGLPSPGAHRKWSVHMFWVNDEVFREDQVHCSWCASEGKHSMAWFLPSSPL